MKKFKKVIAMCLTVVMALSVMSIGAFAESDRFQVEPGQYTGITTIEPQSFGLARYYHAYRQEFYERNATTFEFTTSNPNFKIWVENHSTDVGPGVTYNIRVTKVGYNSLPVFTVAANSSNAKAFNGFGAGTYQVQIENSGGYDIKGLITVRSETYELTDGD